MVTYDLFVKEPIYFNIFECGKNVLNRIDKKCEQACMATPRDKYYTKLYETLVDYNYCNDSPLSNEKIVQAILKFVAEEEADACNINLYCHNVTADTFCQAPITPNK